MAGTRGVSVCSDDWAVGGDVGWCQSLSPVLTVAVHQRDIMRKMKSVISILHCDN